MRPNIWYDFPGTFTTVAIRRSRRLRMAIRIVGELTKIEGLSPTGKIVYVAAMLQQPPSITALANSLGMHRRTVIEQCENLERLGWLRFTTVGHSRRPDAVLPRDTEEALAAESSRLIRQTSFVGEGVSNRFVDWIVAPTVHLVYNARPSYLKNRKTGQRMEFDLLAPDYAWALEHQGDEHFGPTTWYPGDKEFAERHKRDLQKAETARKNRIRLSTVSCLDLTLETMQAKIPSDIPRRQFDPKGPYIQMLERLGREAAGPQDLEV